MLIAGLLAFSGEITQIEIYGTISVFMANICIYLLFRLKNRLIPLHFKSR